VSPQIGGEKRDKAVKEFYNPRGFITKQRKNICDNYILTPE